MDIDNEKFDAYLDKPDTTEPSIDETALDGYLENPEEIEKRTLTPDEAAPKFTGLTGMMIDEKSPQWVQSLAEATGEFAGAANANLLDLIGLPGDTLYFYGGKI